MFVVNSYVLAIVMCFMTMLLWGSWSNTLKLVDSKKWPFLLFCWDYSFGFLAVALILAFTLGSHGIHGSSFLENWHQASGHALLMALLAGIIFNLGNLFFIAAVELTGISTAITIGVGTSLILGVISNYIAMPIGDPICIFGGVIAIFCGIVLSGIVYNRIPEENVQHSKLKGIIVALLCGLLLGVFFRFLAISMNTKVSGHLTPYSALVIFSLGIIASNKVWCLLFRKIKLVVHEVIPHRYFEGTKKEHGLGFLGGSLFSLGLAFSLLATNKAGFAISFGLGQSCIMIAMLWGIFYWREFKNTPKSTNGLLLAMFLLYIVGIVAIVMSH